MQASVATTIPVVLSLLFVGMFYKLITEDRYRAMVTFMHSLAEKNKNNNLKQSGNSSGAFGPSPQIYKINEQPFLYDRKTLDWIKANLIAPTYNKPYKLVNPNTKDFSQYKQSSRIIPEVLKNKRNGRFVEVGAADGESLSNTLTLEKYYNWTGLLIEAMPSRFQTLRSKNRRSWLLHACLSNKPTLTKTTIEFKALSADQGRFQSINCVSLSAIFTALQWSHIDFFALDVDGLEAQILQSIPWHRVTIDVFQIECGLQCGQAGANAETIEMRHFLRVYMSARGYDEVMTLHNLDLVYKRKGVVL